MGAGTETGSSRHSLTAAGEGMRPVRKVMGWRSLSMQKAGGFLQVPCHTGNEENERD